MNDSTNERWIVVTTVNKPTDNFRESFYRLIKEGWSIVVVGDVSTPSEWGNEKEVFYLSLEKQGKYFPEVSNLIPLRHYSRKNLGYLFAILNGAQVILDTDDDNFIYNGVDFDFPKKVKGRIVSGKEKWVNIYNYFTKELIWPRGLPLEFIYSAGEVRNELVEFECPIQQFLVDKDPDVDAIFRLIFPEKSIVFDKNTEPLILEKNLWSPFNSQCTLFFKEAFPLLYLPCYVSFRLTDIWRSFVAQASLWVNDYNLAFRKPVGYQIRNNHNLMNDFKDEIEGYLNNAIIVERIEEFLKNLEINNLWIGDIAKSIWLLLIDFGFIPIKEKDIINAWYEVIKT